MAASRPLFAGPGVASRDGLFHGVRRQQAEGDGHARRLRGAHDARATPPARCSRSAASRRGSGSRDTRPPRSAATRRPAARPAAARRRRARGTSPPRRPASPASARAPRAPVSSPSVMNAWYSETTSATDVIRSKLYCALFRAPSARPPGDAQRDDGAQGRAHGIRDPVANAWRAPGHEGLMQFVGHARRAWRSPTPAGRRCRCSRPTPRRRTHGEQHAEETVGDEVRDLVRESREAVRGWECPKPRRWRP